MNDFTQSFYRLLDQYVFKMASQVIEMATTEQQSQLIKLVLDIPSHTPSAPIQQASINKLLNAERQPLIPSSTGLIHDPWLRAMIQRQIRRNQVSIAHVEVAIEITQRRYQVGMNGFLSETAQANLELWTSQTLKQYERYLITLQTIQRNNLDRLSRLSHS